MPRYEFSEGASNKFWDIKMRGASFTTTFGKIGSNGQIQLKEFSSASEAQKAYDKLIAEKTKKGYTLAEGSGPTKAAPAAPAAKAAKAAKPAAKTTPSDGMYFEFVEGSSSKFWEIAIAGTTVTTRYGKIGTPGQSTPKTYKSAGEAKAEHDKLVAEKTKKGYKLVRGAAPAAPVTTSARDAKLEAMIEAAPDDVHGYEVYADWLQAQGDPRGELIALQIANKTAPAKKLIEQNKAHFYAKLADATDMLERYEYHPLGDNTHWRWGYLEKLWISHKFDRSSMHGGERQELDVADALESLLASSSTRFLRELTVGIESYEDNSYDHIAKLIAKHPKPTLKKLILGDFYSEETELNWSNMGDVSPMYKAVPNLESLTLRSGTMKVGKIDLPKLREAPHHQRRARQGLVQRDHGGEVAASRARHAAARRGSQVQDRRSAADLRRQDVSQDPAPRPRQLAARRRDRAGARELEDRAAARVDRHGEGHDGRRRRRGARGRQVPQARRARHRRLLVLERRHQPAQEDREEARGRQEPEQ